ncbi:MAG: thioredoxin domain-containing protein [Deltaproteobacteria bacterium]|nr:thioredoxin domain-containing protein [Deltaproteobacteria bacterium]
MPNRLARESSPYLRQHMHNPVDWYPWGDEALTAARTADRPILLSVGYAACHWCHVMEHESFEDGATAALMNERFVNIKVDREERPDLDHLYMAACQLFTGAGGWPLTVFLTPDLRPFFAGSYFPPDDRYGRPGFPRVLRALSDAWRNDRNDVTEQAARFLQSLSGLADGPAAGRGAQVDAGTVTRAAGSLLRRLDPRHGGFGGAPKFPHAQELRVLELAARRGHEAAGKASLLTLACMSDGGIHDQLGGGFHRYSVDERWAVPHFEKMLYDNALLPCALLAAYRRTGEPWLADVVRGTLGWVAREMTAPGGGLFASQDADSEGHEGKYFVWRPAEVRAVLGDDDARAFILRHGVDERGNFEDGATVLHVAAGWPEVARELGWSVEDTQRRLALAREAMLRARQARVAPATDDKVLAGWNGLMVSTLCDAGTTLGDAALLDAARRALDFVLGSMRADDGGLLRVHAAGTARIPGFLEDYAAVATAACDQHRATGESRWLQAARELGDQILARFASEDGCGFFATEAGRADVIIRSRSTADDSVPSGTALAAGALAYTGALCGLAAHAAAAAQILEAFGAELAAHPGAHATLLQVADRAVRGEPSVVVAGPGAEALLAAARGLADPSVAVVDARDDAVAPALRSGKEAVNGKAAAYVCAGNTCQAPVTDIAGLKAALRQADLWVSRHPEAGR